jgi:ABC-type transport system substrate-binding protein
MLSVFRAAAVRAAVVCGAVLSIAAGAHAAEPEKVLRYAMRVAETGFDPAQISDLYSATMTGHIFDALYAYEFLARPVRVRPNTATALPEASADFTTFTVHVRPGIYFSDDPAFKGQRRELVAADYVYSIKRHFDPRWKSPRYADLANNRIIGLEDVRNAAIKGKRAFD